MEKIFDRQNVGVLLIMNQNHEKNQYPYLEKFIEVGINKENPQFLNLIWSTTNDELRSWFTDYYTSMLDEAPKNCREKLLALFDPNTNHQSSIKPK